MSKYNGRNLALAHNNHNECDLHSLERMQPSELGSTPPLPYNEAHTWESRERSALMYSTPYSADICVMHDMYIFKLVLQDETQCARISWVEQR